MQLHFSSMDLIIEQRSNISGNFIFKNASVSGISSASASCFSGERRNLACDYSSGSDGTCGNNCLLDKGEGKISLYVNISGSV